MHTTELQAKLKSLKTTALEELARLSGVSERALWNIRTGKTKTAGEETKDKLRKHLAVLMRRKK